MWYLILTLILSSCSSSNDVVNSPSLKQLIKKQYNFVQPITVHSNPKTRWEKDNYKLKNLSH